jgi:hypothetical protein
MNTSSAMLSHFGGAETPVGVAMQRGVQGGRNSGKAMTYGEA